MSGRLRRYLRHLASLAGRQAVGLGVNLVLTAFLYRRLGAEGYGVWAIALALGSYIGLVDLNTNASVVKYTAELEATGRRDQLAPMVHAGIQILFSLSFGLLALALAGLPWLTPLIFKTAAYAPGDLMLLAALCLLSFALLQTGSVYQQVLQGLLRQDEVNAISALGLVVNALAAAAVVAGGMGIVWLGAANLLGTLTVLAATRVRLAALAPELPWMPLRSTPRWRRELLGFSAGSYAFTLWGWLYFTVPRMLLANQLGPVVVGYHDVATKLGSIGRNLVQSFSQYLIPFLSEKGAKDGAQALRALQERALTFLWMLGLGVGGFFIAVHEPLLLRWVHGDALLLQAAAFWVLLEYSLGGLSMPWVHFALAEGRLRHARPFLAYIIPACVLGPWLGLRWGGFSGFLQAGAAVNALGTALFYWLAVRERGIHAAALAWRLGRVAAGAGAAWLVLAQVDWDASLPALALAGLLWAACLILAWGAFGLWERGLLGRVLSSLKAGREGAGW